MWAFADSNASTSQLTRMSRVESVRIGVKYDPLSDIINVRKGPVSLILRTISKYLRYLREISVMVICFRIV